MSSFLSDKKESFTGLGTFLKNPINLVLVLLLAAATLLVYNNSYDEWSGLNTLSTNCAQSGDFKTRESVKFWVSISLSIAAILAGIAMTIFLSGTPGLRIISLSILITGAVGLLLTMYRKFPFLTGQGSIAITWLVWLALIGAAVVLDIKSKGGDSE